MTPKPARERKRRRVASDEAHAWARNLQLHNPYAKSVLRALSIYSNEFGCCNPGISTIAADTDLSDDTVRKRLKFLEDVGAIVRMPCWRDEQGRVNSEGRGKRTTDEIRLMLDADPDAIEACALGDAPDQTASRDDEQVEFSPRQQRGLNSDDENVSPAPAPGQPSQCGEGLISEPEPEDSPQAPLAGGVDESEADKAKREFHRVGFRREYPRPGRWDWSAADADFAAMSLADCERAHAAAPHYAREFSRPSSVPKRPEAWLRKRMFENFPDAKVPDAPKAAPEAVWYSDESDEFRAIAVACALAGEPAPSAISRPGIAGRWIRRAAPVGPDLLVLSSWYDAIETHAFPVDHFAGSAQCEAWRARLADWLRRDVKPRRVWLEPYDASVHGVSPLDANFRVRRSFTGLRVPWEWPPRRDGTLFTDGNSQEGV